MTGILSGITCLACILFVADAQMLVLTVEPVFEFVNEDWPVGRALPSMSLCAKYSGQRPLRAEITSGDPFNYFRLFSINDTCWGVILQKALDADIANSDGSRGQSFSLTFRLTDEKRQAYGNADIQVVDLNDNAPRFVDTKSAVSVPEDAEVGKTLFTATTFDPDTGVGGINNFYLEDDFRGTFKIRNGSCFDAHCTAEVSLNSKLNYDTKNVYSLTIVAFDGAGRNKVRNEMRFPVVVTVLDVQNNPPKFLVDNRIYFVPENTVVGTEVFSVFASDGDTGVSHPHQILYSLQVENEYFSVNTSTGWIYVKSSLDRESSGALRTNGAVTLIIRAEEETEEPRPFSVVNLTAIITDVDDEPPRCNLTRYTGQILENSLRYVPITLTNAEDLYVYDNDEAANGEFQLSLSGDHGAFEISSKIVYNIGNVLIRVANSSLIDYERYPVFNFKLLLTPVLSKDKKSNVLPTACEISVSVLDVNDNFPQFKNVPIQTRISESLPVNSPIAKIEVYDLDTPQYLPIVVKLSGWGSESFRVDANGTIRTNAVLDREKRSTYQLTLTATDEGGRGNSNSTSVQIDILDENDNAPRYSKDTYTLYLVENTVDFVHYPFGFFVEAVDDDEPDTPNSNISYSMKESYGYTLFHLDPNTGEFMPLSPGIDVESMSAEYFNFTVVARDQAAKPLSGYATILVYVNDTNDNVPIFSTPIYQSVIYENATAGDFVITVTATDLDRSPFNSLLAYRIVDVQDKFVIDSQTGTINVADGASLDRDSSGRDQYRLTVAAIDQGVPSQTGTAVVEVTVIDINNKPPRFLNTFLNVAVPEDIRVGSSLASVTARDLDKDAKLVYQIAGYSEARTDDGLQVDQRKYNYSKLFSINATTGQLFVAGSLDREQMERVIIIVNVTDQNGTVNVPQTAQTMVELQILDVNDIAPRFTRESYNRSVLENAEIGSLILSVSAIDRDKNRTIVYSILENSTTLVSIDQFSGEITVIGVIDYEQIHWINFTVSASDTGNPPLSSLCSVSLRVIDQNDNSPQFHTDGSVGYAATLSEASPVGTFVLRVNATDADSGSFGNVSYFLLNDLESEPHFSLNESTGILSIRAPLDRELRPSYALTVRAVDDYTGHVNPGSHETTTVVHVALSDVNDNAPEFAPNTPKSIVLTENNAAGALVMTYAATDKDDPATGNGQIRYIIVGGNASINHEYPLFILNSTTGALLLAANVTGLNGLYSLTVEARDLGQPSLTSKINTTVKIQDYNDHRPTIIEPMADSVYFIAENNFTEFAAIAKLNAIDTDEGLNAELRFSLREHSTNEDWKYFRVDTISGDLYAKGAFDYERQNRYRLTAQACDMGQPSLCDEVDFVVVILDRDDNCPMFRRSVNYTLELRIQENQPADYVVGQLLEAHDRDTEPENVRICYKIVGGDEQTAFRLVSQSNNTLLATKSFDRETKDSYELIVETNDCNDNTVCSKDDMTSSRKKRVQKNDPSIYQPNDNSYLYVKILISDVNDQIPFFVQSSFRGGVRYDTKIATRVAKVRAEDLDLVDVGQLTYSIVGQIQTNLADDAALDFHRPPFIINETTGDVITNVLFQPSWKGAFEFVAKAKDSAGHSTTAPVVVNLLGYDQQLELLFEAPANRLWDEAYKVIDYLSIATNSNATIDDILPYESYGGDSSTRESQSKVLAHFVDEHARILTIDAAIEMLDRPKTNEQKQAKQRLISIHHLRYAGHNPDPTSSLIYHADSQTLTALAAVIGGLLLVMVVLVSIWCVQHRTYRRKLKAAATLAFSNADMVVPAYDLPGTNLHASSNPVWSPNENFAYDHDRTSEHSINNSLDNNDLAYQIHSALKCGSQMSTLKVSTLQVDTIKCETVHERRLTVDEFDSEEQVVPPAPTMHVGNETPTLQSQQPKFPRPILSNLESTEL